MNGGCEDIGRIVGLRSRKARFGFAVVADGLSCVSGVEIRCREKEIWNWLDGGEFGACGGGFSSIDDFSSVSVTRFKNTHFVDSR